MVGPSDDYLALMRWREGQPRYAEPVRDWFPGNRPVPFELLDGETFTIAPTALRWELARHGCVHPVQCVREFEAFGVTKFAVGSEGGRWTGESVTLRAED